MCPNVSIYVFMWRGPQEPQGVLINLHFERNLWSPVLVGHTQNRREVVYSSRRAQSVMAQHEPSKQPGKRIQFFKGLPLLDC